MKCNAMNSTNNTQPTNKQQTNLFINKNYPNSLKAKNYKTQQQQQQQEKQPTTTTTTA